jgi:hypothetical protein
MWSGVFPFTRTKIREITSVSALVNGKYIPYYFEPAPARKFWNSVLSSFPFLPPSALLFVFQHLFLFSVCTLLPPPTPTLPLLFFCFFRSIPISFSLGLWGKLEPGGGVSAENGKIHVKMFNPG